MSFKDAIHVLIIGYLLCFSSATTAGDWSGSFKVTELYPSPDNNGVLIKQDVMVDPDSCGFDSFYVLEKDNVLFSQMFSLLMSAQARGAEVQIHLAGCSTHATPKPKISTLIAR